MVDQTIIMGSIPNEPDQTLPGSAMFTPRPGTLCSNADDLGVPKRWATLGLMWVVPQVVVSPSSGTFLAQKTRLETASSENWRVTSSCGKHQSFRKLGASSPPVGLRMS